MAKSIVFKLIAFSVVVLTIVALVVMVITVLRRATNPPDARQSPRLHRIQDYQPGAMQHPEQPVPSIGTFLDETLLAPLSRAFGRGGRAVGRPRGGPRVPPAVPERLVSAGQRSPAAVHSTTVNQEVIMTGEATSESPCLGGATEMQIELVNDLEADQIDFGYTRGSTFVKLGSSGGNGTSAKQCVPRPPPGSDGLRLECRVFYFLQTDVQNDAKAAASTMRNEKRVLPHPITGTENDSIRLNASNFAILHSNS